MIKKFVLTGILSGIALFIATNIIGFIVQLILPYDIMSIGGMRAIDDPLMILFFASFWVISFIMTYAYIRLQKSFTGSQTKRANEFAVLIFLIYIVPSFFIIATSMNYPIGFLADQLIGGIIGIRAASCVITRIIK